MPGPGCQAVFVWAKELLQSVQEPFVARSGWEVRRCVTWRGAECWCEHKLQDECRSPDFVGLSLGCPVGVSAFSKPRGVSP